jgi:hypothetical protein
MVTGYKNGTMAGLTVEIVVRERKCLVFQLDLQQLQKSEEYASKCGLIHQSLRTAAYGALVKQMVGEK